MQIHTDTYIPHNTVFVLIGTSTYLQMVHLEIADHPAALDPYVFISLFPSSTTTLQKVSMQPCAYAP